MSTKIIYPSQPPTPAAPTLASVASGALGAATLYVSVTYVTLDGEGLPSDESSISLAASHVVKVTSPPLVDAPTVPYAYNVYAGAAAGTGTKQNATPIQLGTDWQEPNTGLAAGTAKPTSWGTTLTIPDAEGPKKVAYTDPSAVRHDTVSTSGVQQSVLERVDQLLDFDVANILLSSEAAGWNSFLQAAVKGIPFDLYPDPTRLGNGWNIGGYGEGGYGGPTFTSFYLVDQRATLKYQAAGIYMVSLKLRAAMGAVM